MARRYSSRKVAISAPVSSARAVQGSRPVPGVVLGRWQRGGMGLSLLLGLPQEPERVHVGGPSHSQPPLVLHRQMEPEPRHDSEEHLSFDREEVVGGASRDIGALEQARRHVDDPCLISSTTTTVPLIIFSIPRRLATSMTVRCSRLMRKSMSSSENTRTPDNSVRWLLRPSRSAGPIQADAGSPPADRNAATPSVSSFARVPRPRFLASQRALTAPPSATAPRQQDVADMETSTPGRPWRGRVAA